MKTQTTKKTSAAKQQATPENTEQRFTSAMETYVKLFPEADVAEIKKYIHDASELFREMSDRDLTLGQRRRKVGAGIKNYGFIVKTAELAVENPQFASLFNLTVLQNCISNFDESRNINILLQAMMRQTSNSMLTYSDEAYSLSLLFYNSVRELARRGVPDAITLFRQLQPFFRNHRTSREGKEPTEVEIMHDAKALMKGTKDGEIIIKNERPKTVGGKRTIVDETRKDKVAIRRSDDAEVEE
jgi:hypothetical protein